MSTADSGCTEFSEAYSLPKVIGFAVLVFCNSCQLKISGDLSVSQLMRVQSCECSAMFQHRHCNDLLIYCKIIS